jgi:hypothetical protein
VEFRALGWGLVNPKYTVLNFSDEQNPMGPHSAKVVSAGLDCGFSQLSAP